MTTRLILLLVLATLKVSGQGNSAYIPYEEALTKVADYNSEKNYEKALEVLNQIHPSDSNNCGIEVSRSYYLMNLKRFQESLEVTNKGLANGCPDWRASLYINKGIALLNSEEYEACLSVYNQALEEFPMNPELWYNKGKCLETMGRNEQAVRMYEEALRRNPFYRLAYRDMGNIYYKQHQMGQALMSYNLFQLLAPDADDALQILQSLNNIAGSVNENEPKPDVSLGTDDEGFQQIDLILEQRVALSEGYETGNDIDIALVRQNHALLQQLKDFKGSGGFWETALVPFYQWIQGSDQFNTFIYTLCYSIENAESAKVIQKNTSEIETFFNEYKEKLSELLTKGSRERDGNTESVTYYHNGEYVVGRGVVKEDNPIGFWEFYDSSGRRSGLANFDSEGIREGEYRLFHPEGNLKETGRYIKGEIQGKVVTYHPNGRMETEGNYQAGVLEGEFRSYSPTEALLQKKYFRKGELDALYSSYFRVGETLPEFQIQYSSGKIVQTATEFYSNGSVYQETPHTEGEKDGVEVNFYLNGKPYSKIEYHGGMLHGSYLVYHSNGQLQKQGQAAYGQLYGSWKTFYPDGVTESEYEMDNGKIHGLYSYYEKDGKLHYTYQYRNGEIIEYAFYDREGTLLKEGRKKGGSFNYTGLTPTGLKWSEGLYDISGGKEGEWKFYQNDGVLNEKGTFRNNLKEGRFETYHLNGQLQAERTYAGDSLNGASREYHLNGALSQRGAYSGDWRHGPWETYYADGAIETTSYYHKGKLHGVQTNYTNNGVPYKKMYFQFGDLQSEVFYGPQGQRMDSLVNVLLPGETKGLIHFTNGKVSQSYTFLNGMLHGAFDAYYADGGIKTSGHYVNGNQDGEWVWYHPNGKVETKVPILLGRRHGLFQSFYEDGTLEDQTLFELDLPVGTSESYYEDGSLQTRTQYSEGELHGRKEFYGPAGHLQLVRFYEHGKLVGYSYADREGGEMPVIAIENETGPIKSYYDNGKLSRDFEVFRGVFNGPYKEYYYSGQVFEEMHYTYGEFDGVRTCYYPDGSLKFTRPYVLGDLHGEVLEYYPGGILKESANYAHGNRNGMTRLYDQNGGLLKETMYFNDEEAPSNPN